MAEQGWIRVSEGVCCTALGIAKHVEQHKWTTRKQAIYHVVVGKQQFGQSRIVNGLSYALMSLPRDILLAIITYHSHTVTLPNSSHQ